MKNQAVWYQPASLFAYWKSQGVDTLVGYESGEVKGPGLSVEKWAVQAQAAGLRYFIQTGDAVRSPLLGQPSVINHPLFAGWILPDEPNGVGNLSPDVLQSIANAARAVSNSPLLLSLDGWKMQWQDDGTIRAYCAAASIIANDYYIINRGEGPGSLSKLASTALRLRYLSGGKPIWQTQECSNQLLNKQAWTKGNDATGTPLGPKMRGPTGIEIAQQVDQALQAGVDGLLWFPDAIGENWENYNNMTDEQASVMRVLNWWLKRQ